MTGADWADPGARSLCLYLDGSDAPDLDLDGTLLVDDDFLLMVNAWWEPLDFVIPTTRPGQVWHRQIECQLVFYDDTVLSTIRSRPAGALANAEGTVGNAGTLWGGGGLYFRLLVLSPTDALPYNFLKARLRGSYPQKIGTRRTLWNLEFLALPYSGASGATANTVLYNRTTT